MWRNALLGFLSAGAVVLLLAAEGKPQEPTRARRVGTSEPQGPYAVCADPSGVYVAGLTTRPLVGQTMVGHADAFLRKYASDGDELWTRQFGSDMHDKAAGVCAAGGDVYVAGFTRGALPGQTNEGVGDAFVRKYDARGQELWTRQFGTDEQDGVEAICTARDGVYVAGFTAGALPGQANEGSNDAFVRRYDTRGDEVWTRQFGTEKGDLVSAVCADSGGVYVTGRTGGVFPGQTNGADSEVFVRKYEGNGDELWTTQFGTSGSDNASGIASDSRSAYVVGTLGWFGPHSGMYGFVQKYDPDGHERWRKDGWMGPLPGAVWADDTGLYVAGCVYGTLPGKTSAGKTDAFVRKYSPNGKKRWTRQFGTSDDDWVRDVCVEGSRTYVVGGAHGGIGRRGFVRKFGARGEDVWQRWIDAG